jgi:hypothetical protein
MTTTLLFYAHRFPKGDRRYVEPMESVRASAPLLDMLRPATTPVCRSITRGWTRVHGTTSESDASDLSEAPDFVGGVKDSNLGHAD